MADITRVPHMGWLYLALVLDVWSPRVIGWRRRPTCGPNGSRPRWRCRWRGAVRRSASCTTGSRLAVHLACRPERRVVHHWDRGSQYTSPACGERCQESGIAQSVGSAGEPTTTPCARASITRDGCTRPSATSRRPTTGGTMRPEANPRHRANVGAVLRPHDRRSPPLSDGSRGPCRTETAYGQPQKSTVRESGTAPAGQLLPFRPRSGCGRPPPLRPGFRVRRGSAAAKVPPTWKTC